MGQRILRLWINLVKLYNHYSVDSSLTFLFHGILFLKSFLFVFIDFIIIFDTFLINF